MPAKEVSRTENKCYHLTGSTTKYRQIPPATKCQSHPRRESKVVSFGQGIGFAVDHGSLSSKGYMTMKSQQANAQHTATHKMRLLICRPLCTCFSLYVDQSRHDHSSSCLLSANAAVRPTVCSSGDNSTEAHRNALLIRATSFESSGMTLVRIRVQLLVSLHDLESPTCLVRAQRTLVRA